MLTEAALYERQEQQEDLVIAQVEAQVKLQENLFKALAAVLACRR